MRKAIRVVLVEDDPDLRENLADYLHLAGYDVTSLGSALEYYRCLHSSNFDVGIFDLGLPDLSGLELVADARRKTDMGIIVLTALSSVNDQIKGYDAGSDIYMTKPVDCEVLARAVNNLAGRIQAGSRAQEVPALPDLLPVWTLQLSQWSLLSPDNRKISLTAKELEFLKILGRNPGEPASREALMRALYPRIDKYTCRALDALVRRLRLKIAQRTDDLPPIMTVHSIGYCFSASLQFG